MKLEEGIKIKKDLGSQILKNTRNFLVLEKKLELIYQVKQKE